MEDLDTGTTDEVAWGALGAQYARAPWKGASFNAARGTVGAGAGTPPLVMRPPDCPSTGSLSGTFYGWSSVPDALFKPTFVNAPEQSFARAADVNQALSGFLVDQIGPMQTPDGPTFWLKSTSGNGASQLPNADPLGGVGFNLSQNVPYNSLANVFGQPTLFKRSNNDGKRALRVADLSA